MIKEFITGVRLEIQTEYWLYPDNMASPEYKRTEEKRKEYEQEMVAKGWKIGWPRPCYCCNVGFYRRVKVWPWGRV